jgi:subfamily B ATP-binding cassette protein MsbA
MKSLIKILRYIKPYKFDAFLSVGFNLIAIILNLVSLVVFIPFLDLLFGEVNLVLIKPTFELSIDYLKEMFSYLMTPFIEEQGKKGALLFVCVTVVSLFFLKNLFGKYSEWSCERYSEYYLF